MAWRYRQGGGMPAGPNFGKGFGGPARAPWMGARGPSMQPQQKPPAEKLETHTYGFKSVEQFKEKYELGRDLGSGAYAKVRVAKDKTGAELACKMIPKIRPAESYVSPPPPGQAQARQEQYEQAVFLEVETMRHLRGCLNVVHLEEVYEDEDYVYVVTEFCTGGALWKWAEKRQGGEGYTEAMVSRFMRGTLQTLAQMHSKHMLHRDIKPSNFLLLNDSEAAPLKAIDFGLAVPFVPGQPRTDLGLDGTPLYLAPEVLQGEVWPKSDVWQAGVMAFQLLSGRMPFDDRDARGQPGSVAALLRAILEDDVPAKLVGPDWEAVSEEAKDFVRTLLDRNIDSRPTALEALNHPFVRKKSWEGGERPLGATIVPRLQRHAAQNIFKRTLLERVAHELVRSALHGNSAEGGSGRGAAPLSPPMAIPGGVPITTSPVKAGRQSRLRQGSNAGDAPPTFLPHNAQALAYGASVPESAVLASSYATSADIRDMAMSPPDEDAPASLRDREEALELLRSVTQLFDQLDRDGDGAVSLRDLRDALRRYSFHLPEAEARMLMDGLDPTGDGRISLDQFLAGVVDWKALEGTVEWLAAARSIFKDLRKATVPKGGASGAASPMEGTVRGGKVPFSAVMETLHTQLSPDEVRSAMGRVLMEAGVVTAEEWFKNPTVDESVKARTDALRALRTASQLRLANLTEKGRQEVAGLGRYENRLLTFEQFCAMLQAAEDEQDLRLYPARDDPRFQTSQGEDSRDPSIHGAGRMSFRSMSNRALAAAVPQATSPQPRVSTHTPGAFVRRSKDDSVRGGRRPLWVAEEGGSSRGVRGEAGGSLRGGKPACGRALSFGARSHSGRAISGLDGEGGSSGHSREGGSLRAGASSGRGNPSYVLAVPEDQALALELPEGSGGGGSRAEGSLHYDEPRAHGGSLAAALLLSGGSRRDMAMSDRE
ncbi:unnamed protein product [Pedinophyceae sp. YPF-701]|nr:unnamed protein product [Pedinophyceae sp. YPF-701]